MKWTLKLDEAQAKNEAATTGKIVLEVGTSKGARPITVGNAKNAAKSVGLQVQVELRQQPPGQHRQKRYQTGQQNQWVGHSEESGSDHQER